MNILIIEDEHLAVERLELFLERFADMTVVDKLDSVKSAIKWFETNDSPDLLFLDIQLADGLSFEIFEQTTVNCPIIFTTAYDQYAIKAFKLNSIDYLLKPISFQDFKKALEKYKSIHGKDKKAVASSLDLNQLKMAIAQLQNQYKSRFIIKQGDKLLSVTIEQIACFYSEDKYTFLLNNQQQKYIISHTIAQLEAVLNPKLFYRINRKYIVHINAIENIIAYSNSRLRVSLKNSNIDDAIVSRDKVSDFKNWLDS